MELVGEGENEQWVPIPDPLIPNLEEVEKSILNSDCDIGSIIVKCHHFAVKVTHFKSHKISAKFWELREIWEIREFDFPKVEIFSSINEVTLVAAKNL